MTAAGQILFGVRLRRLSRLDTISCVRSYPVRNLEQLEDQVAIDIRGIAPLLSVFDMPTSLKFYCETLGFEVAATDGRPAPQFDWVMLCRCILLRAHAFS